MSKERQQGRIFLIAVALTFLLGGAYGGGVGVNRWWRSRVADPEFIKKLTPEGKSEGPGAGSPAQPPGALVRVGQARVEEVCPETRVVGRLAELRKVTVASEITGNIVAMDVYEGSPVAGGKTVIASIDKVWLDLAIAKQKARIEVIKAQLRRERDNLQRLTALSERGVAPDREQTDQLAAYDQRQAELKEAEVTLQDLEEQRRRIDIVAPFDGWVVLRHAELGQRLSPGSPVVDIVSRGDIYAVMNVPESLVNRLEIGMDIPVMIEPLGEARSGRLHSITPYGSKASRTYPVRVVLSDKEGKLKAGMSVTATFPVGAKQKQIMVSRDAVLIKPDGSIVWIVRPGEPMTAVPAPVEIAARVGDRFAVEPLTSEGRELLVDAAMVVIEGAERLRPNQAVRLMDAKSAEAKSPGEGPGAPAGR
ncbi:MAG: efflux RND transporter periplasmic adaptor subunit [Planctomycetota bacterium]